MISRQNSRKSISAGGTLRRRMQGDPFIRKKTVRYIAIIDQGISGLLLFYAGYRLVNYDFKDESLILLIEANENVFVAMVYWLVVFTLIGLQLVIAFLLLTATKDMTTDPETMIKKCQLWKTFSIGLLVFLTLDLFISLYTYFVLDEVKQRLVSVALDAGEGFFRSLGVFLVGKFITDLHSIFANPMTTLSASSSPVLLPRTVSRTSSMNVGDLMTPPASALCSRTHSMNATGDGAVTPLAGTLCRTMTVPVSRGGRNHSVSVDIFMPKFSRTASVDVPEVSEPKRSQPLLIRTTSAVGSESGGGGSVGRGSRTSGGALVLNLDDCLVRPSSTIS